MYKELTSIFSEASNFKELIQSLTIRSYDAR